MFKTLISPVQAWLISQGRCVACGHELSAGTTEKSKKVKDVLKVTCQCGRVFFKDKSNKYRRALMSEI